MKDATFEVTGESTGRRYVIREGIQQNVFELDRNGCRRFRTMVAVGLRGQTGFELKLSKALFLANFQMIHQPIEYTVTFEWLPLVGLERPKEIRYRDEKWDNWFP